MKSGFNLPKYAKIAWLISGTLFIFCGAVWLLALGGIHLFLLGISTPELTVFLLFLCLLFALAGLIFWATGLSKCKWLILVSALLAAHLGLYMLFALAVVTTGNPYFTFVSPDKQHEIVICEKTLLTNGGGPVYEKTSPYTMRLIGHYITPDADRPFSDDNYKIIWHQDTLELQYLFQNPYLSDGSHETVMIEYWK